MANDVGDKDKGVFLIHELWVDSMENHPSQAMGYNVVGYVTSRARAEQLVAEAGVRNGEGWPIQKGKSEPKRKFTEIPCMD